MGDDSVDGLGPDDLRARAGDRLQPDEPRGRLLLVSDDLDGDRFLEDLDAEITAGLDLRLSFEAWADSR